MKRKFLISVLTLACASCCAIGLAACNDKNPDDTGRVDPDNYPTYTRPEANQETKLKYEYDSASGTYVITQIGDETNTDIVIPSKINGVYVREIASEAFTGKSNLTSVTISDGITTIGARAFANCTKIKSISIPDSVTTVGESAFQNCEGMYGAIIGSGLKNISDAMFSGCYSLRTITIPDNVKSIGSDAFRNCTMLRNITMGSGVQTIGNMAFYDCSSLTDVELGSGVQTIGNNVFQDCINLERIVLPNSVTYVGIGLLRNCANIRTISVPFVGAFPYLPDEDAHDNSTDAIPPTSDDEGEENPGVSDNSSAIDRTNPRTYGHYGYYFGATSNFDNLSYTNTLFNHSGSTGYYAEGVVTVIITGSAPICRGAFNQAIGVKSVIITGEMTELHDQAFGFAYQLNTLVLPKSIQTLGDGVTLFINNFKTIYYSGTEADWRSVKIGSDNNNITSAKKFYNSFYSAEYPEAYKNIKVADTEKPDFDPSTCGRFFRLVSGEFVAWKFDVTKCNDYVADTE